MRYLYSLLIYLLTPALFGYFAYRGFSDRRWLSRWIERLGDFDATGWMEGIVVHAASVGEVNAAAPLVREIVSRWPDLPLTITCFTPTGSERVRALFGDSVRHVYAPIDTPGGVRRFFNTLKPRALIVMETEIWPNLFHRAGSLGIPVLISNARLTERSLKSWRRFGGLAEKTLAHVTLVAAQDAAEARRFRELGADPDHTRVAGNLKYEIELPPDVAREGREWRERWGAQRRVMVAGSTHEDDEAALVESLRGVLAVDDSALLVLAPRHPERFERVFEQVRASGLRAVRMSDDEISPAAQCMVVDRMGALLALYAAADFVFVGGTLAPVGGHTPLEAAATGRPLLVGPNDAHIREIAEALVTAGGAARVANRRALVKTWIELSADPALCERMGRIARELVDHRRGALQRNVQIIEAMLFQ